MSELVIYTKPTGCYQCKYIKKFLDKTGVRYTEIQHSDATESEFVARGYNSVPVVVLKGDRGTESAPVFGLDIDSVKALIEQL